MNKIVMILIFTLFSLSCNRKWKEKNKQEFVGGCLNTAIKTMNDDKAKAYCKCLLEKVMAKYPNANDAAYIKHDTSMVRLAKECYKQE